MVFYDETKNKNALIICLQSTVDAIGSTYYGQNFEMIALLVDPLSIYGPPNLPTRHFMTFDYGILEE